MECVSCLRQFDLITNQPYRICSNKHTVCEQCLASISSVKEATCKRCSQPIQNARLCFTTLYNIPNALPVTVLPLTLLLSGGLMWFLHSRGKLQLQDLSNLRVYLLVTAIFYLVGQWHRLLFTVIPAVKQLRKNPQPGLGAPYIFTVILRQASLWNWRSKHTAWSVLLGFARHAWLMFNIYEYCTKIDGFGSEFVLSLVVAFLSMGDLPIHNKVLIWLNHAIKLFAQGITAVVGSISQVLLHVVVYSIVVILAALSFWAYLYELQFLQIFQFKLKHLWWAFPLPLLLNNFLVQAPVKWIVVAAYQNASLAMSALLRRNILLDVLVAATTLPILLGLNGTVFVQYMLHHVIGVNLEMKVQICSVLNLLLTPMHMALYLLLKEVPL